MEAQRLTFTTEADRVVFRVGDGAAFYLTREDLHKLTDGSAMSGEFKKAERGELVNPRLAKPEALALAIRLMKKGLSLGQAARVMNVPEAEFRVWYGNGVRGPNSEAALQFINSSEAREVDYCATVAYADRGQGYPPGFKFMNLADVKAALAAGRDLVKEWHLDEADFRRWLEDNREYWGHL